MSVQKELDTRPVGHSPHVYAAWFLMKPAAIPPVSRPDGRGSWYKNQAQVLSFMIFNFICSLNQVFLQSETAGKIPAVSFL